MEKLDSSLQDGKALAATSAKHGKTDTADGISQELIQSLQAAIDDATEKDTAQKKAVEAVGNLTALQDTAMENGLALIRKTQNAAKSAFGEDNKPKMREFHVGGDYFRTVKAMTSELKYMKSTASDYLPDLTKGGLKQTDLARFDSISADLSKYDVQQENAKKAQKRATNERDGSMKELQRVMRKVRHAAETIFADQQSVLIEFEPIAEGRSGGGKKDQPASTQTGQNSSTK